MREHEQFGRPPNLRPRTAGATRSQPTASATSIKSPTQASRQCTSEAFSVSNVSPHHRVSGSGPEELARIANDSQQDSSLQLSDRLQIPRPGTATRRQPDHTQASLGNESKPAAYEPVKPPARPKSAIPGARHSSTSQYRMDRIQAAFNSNNPVSSASLKDISKQLPEPETEISRPPATTSQQFHAPSKQDDVRGSSSATSFQTAVARGAQTPFSLLRPSSGLGKRPSSAASNSRFREQDEPATETPVVPHRAMAVGAKRPLSIAPERHRQPARVQAHNQGSPQLEPSIMGVMSSYHRNTFVYAVPLHCVETGRQYNPYDIVTISHEVLFRGPSRMNQQYEAKYDYYTISGAGFTFHVKDDSFNAAFLTTEEWERQKLQFDKISQLSSFQLFRYRKAFVGWKKWVRHEKMETARVNLLSELYFSHPTLFAGMQKVQRELIKLESIQLVRDFDGSTLSLSEFAEANALYLEDRLAEMCNVNAKVQDILISMCHDSLNRMESPHGRFPGHEFAISTRKSSNFHLFDSYAEREMALANADAQFMLHEHFQMSASPSRLSPSKAAQLRTARKRHVERMLLRQKQRPQDRLDEIRWTMAAIRRRKCLHLTKFVYLVDFMQVDAYFVVILRSVEAVYNHLLRGANAAQIRKLTARDDYLMAFHKSLDADRSSPEATPGGGVDSSSSSQLNSIPPDTRRALALTKQQTKRFLRVAWSGKFHVQDSALSVEDTKSAAVWMESALESLFLEALTRRIGEQVNTYRLDDLLGVVEADMSQQLVLPQFVGAQHCIFTRNGTDHSSGSTEKTSRDPSEPGTAASIAENMQNIAILAPVPLFTIVLEHFTTQEHECEIKFRPGLDEIVSLVKRVINGFVDVFHDIPPLSSHPELRSILRFADDIRTSALPASSGDSGSRRFGMLDRRLDEGKGADEQECGDEGSPRSNAERLAERVNEDNYCSLLRIHIDELMSNASDEASQFVDCYATVLSLHTQNERIDFDGIAKQFRRNEYSLANMTREVTNLNEQVRDLNALSVLHDVEFLHFDIRELQKALLPSPLRCLTILGELFPNLAHGKCEQFLAFVRSACRRIQKPIVPDLEAFANYLLQLKGVHDEIEGKDYDLTFLGNTFHVLEKLAFSIPAPTSELFDLCGPEFSALKDQVADATGRRETDIRAYTSLLHEAIKQVEDGIDTLKAKSSDQAVSEMESPCHDARKMSSQLGTESSTLSKRSDRLVWIQNVFAETSSNARQSTNEFGELKLLSTELRLKNELWEAVCVAEEYLNARCNETLREIDVSKMRAIVTHVEGVIKRLQQSSLRISALKRLEDSKNTIEGLTPVIRDLRNENMHERHWTKLEHKLQCSFSIPMPDDACELDATVDDRAGSESGSSLREAKYLDLPLRHLLEIQAVSRATAIHQVSEEATAEAAIAKSFASVLQTWEVKEIPTWPKKDRDGREAYCLGDCEEILALLEESDVLLRVMDFSSYASSIQPKLGRLLSDLAHTKEALELLHICQQKWEYMQRLVSADFVRSFPEEAKNLQKHDANWRSAMETLAKRPLCVSFGTSADNRRTLQVIIDGFEMVTKSLAEHLEVKRQVFPAFFRLSTFELAILLSRSRDVNNIQQFLYQCFDNVGRIVFGTRDTCQDILSITSRAFADAETIHMGKNVKARGPPEQWLASVDKRLAEQLRRKTKYTVGIFSELASNGNRATSSLERTDPDTLPVQSILLADRVVRCELIDTALSGIGPVSSGSLYDQLRDDLRKYHHCVLEHLFKDSSGSWEGQLVSARAIVLRSSLFLQDIQFRDALSNHFRSAMIPRLGNFDTSNGKRPGITWELQLKYRLDDSSTVGYECHVEMNGLKVPYGYYYTSPHSEPILSPGSMQTLFSLFACIRNAQGCVLVGPAGSGKATMALQVSRLLGRQYFGTTVSSSTIVSHALRLLRGALHSGGTFCLSIAQSAPSAVEIVKIVAALLAKIEHSALTKLPISGLQKDPIAYIPGTAFILTRQVHYPQFDASAKSEDCLRIWSEQLSQFEVLGCDFDYILEALLSSNAFESPRAVSRKIMAVWHQARSHSWSDEQCSSFSFRAIKTIIESVAVKVSKSKEYFEKTDLQVFLLREEILQYFSHGGGVSKMPCGGLTAIVEAIFQNGEHRNEWFVKQWKREEMEDYKRSFGVLVPHIEAAAKSLHLVPRQALLADTQLLASCLISSVGVILSGESGSGKTTSYEVLAKALDLYRQSFEQDETSNATSASDQQPENVAVLKPPTRQPTQLTAVIPNGLHQELPPPTLESTSRKGKDTSDSVVIIRVILPMALTLTQLYGSTSPDGKGRTKSVLGRLIRVAQDKCSAIRSVNTSASGYSLHDVPTALAPLLAMTSLLWAVFDGPMSTSWLEALSCALTRNPSVALAESALNPARRLLQFQDGEFMTVPPNLRFLFETFSMNDCSPAIVHLNSVICFNGAAPTTSRQGSASVAANADTVEQIHVAYIHRFLSMQRDMVASSCSQPRHRALSMQAFDIVEKWLLESELLDTIFAVIEEYGCAVQLSFLQRVVNLLSLLQVLLHTTTVATSNEASIAPRTTTDGGETLGNDEGVLPTRVRIRIEMSIVYSLMWGFAGCISDNVPLQLLIHGMIKNHFEDIADTWAGCGKDCNLFDTLIDIAGLRFVSVYSRSCDVISSSLRHGDSGANPAPGAQSGSSCLFVPTPTSLLVHAIMKEGIRSGRGVVLVGHGNARRTTLLRNFLSQVDVVNAIVNDRNPSPGKATMALSSTNPRQSSPSASAATDRDSTLASVERIRFHQISLVTRLAAKFKRVHHDGAAGSLVRGTSGLANAPSVPPEATQAPVWTLEPSFPLAKPGVTDKFDSGDYVPFFFTMNRQSRGVSEIAQCMERMLQRERTGVFEPPPGKIAILIIDDLHLPTAERQDATGDDHSSCHEYLRSVYEHSKVFAGDEASTIRIENLLMVASVASRGSGTDAIGISAASHRTNESLAKLVHRFFPVLAHSCTLQETHQIFIALSLSQWERPGAAPSERLPQTVRHLVPLIVAGTTVLWEKLRRSVAGCGSSSRPIPANASSKLQKHCFNLHDLARVYEGICSVAPSFLLDADTFMRLWTHECMRTFSDPFVAIPGYTTWISKEIWRLRGIMESIDNRHDAELNPGSSSLSTMGRQGVGTQHIDPVHTHHLNPSLHRDGYLAFLSAEYLDKKPAAGANSAAVAQQPRFLSAREQDRRAMGSLWGFVPQDLYYQTLKESNATRSENGGGHNPTSDDSRQRHSGHRSSIAFLRRKNLQAANFTASSSNPWIYAEIYGEDVPEDAMEVIVQHLFGAIRTYSTTNSVEQEALSSLFSARLPKNAPHISRSLACSVARIDRVYARLGSKMVLVGEPGCGRDFLLRYVCASRGLLQRQTVVTFEGQADADAVIAKWNLLLRELYGQIGIDCDNVTLIVKRVDLLPRQVASQLLSLMATGEIPGCFSLEEQIRMATRVRDERLVEMDNTFHAQNTRIRQEWDLQREKELATIKKREKETLSINSAAFYQEFERTHGQTLAFRLAQAQLRYQQDCDDYTRKLEVETESVTATIMSLMRPLGITSGRWQQIIDRIRKRLRIVFMVDYIHYDRIASCIPALLPMCSVVPIPRMSGHDLHTIFYGHFHSEVQRLMRSDRFAVNPEIHEWEAFVAFMEKVKLELPQITKMAVDLHVSATNVASQHHRSVPTGLAMVVPTYFAKSLEHFYKRQSETLAKAESFLNMYACMAMDLDKLQDGGGELHDLLRDCERQIAVHEESIAQQQEDGDRIRDMMRRFQATAEEQVQVTNEMEKQAQVELRVPLACLEEANAALLLIEKRHITEIKSFNSPPLLVHLVFDAICVMFSMEPTWENARRILSDSNVVQNMLHYDKDTMSDEILLKLETQYIRDYRFHREEVERQSVAASMMVIWVRAIYQYASTRRVVKPALDKLETAQSRLQLLLQEYQVSKQRVADADEQLLGSKTALGEALDLKQKTTQEIGSRAMRLESGRCALEFLSEDKQQMEKIVDDAHKVYHHGLTWWNALLNAAVLAYAGQCHSEDRQLLFVEWENAYWRNTRTDSDRSATKCYFLPTIHAALRERGAVDGGDPTSDNSNNEQEGGEDVVDLFHRGNEHKHWELVNGGGICFSRRCLQDAFFLSQVDSAALPVMLITNGNNEVEELVLKCARNLWKWREFRMVNAKAEDFEQVFVAAVNEGHQLLVLDVEPLDGVVNFGKLAPIFNWKTTFVHGVEHLVVQSPVPSTTHNAPAPSTATTTCADESRLEMIPIHGSLRIILTSHKPQSAFGEAILTLPTLDAAIHASETQDMILDKMWDPDVLQCGESAKLKQAVREYDLLARSEGKLQSELLKLVEDAAVQGDFQVPAMQSLREKSNAKREMGLAMQRQRIEVEEEINRTRQLVHLAKLGAAIYNSFNAAISAHTTPTRSPAIAIEMFLPLLFSAFKTSMPSSTASPESHPPQQQQQPHSPTSSTSSSGAGAPVPPMIRAASGFQRQLTRLGSSRKPAPQTASFSSTPEIIKQMLHLLMPLVSCQTTWYRFILQLIWTLEENQSQSQRDVRRQTGVANTQDSESLTRDAQPGTVGDCAALLPTNVKTILLLKKLSRWGISCNQQELLSVWHELCVLDTKSILSRILHGVLVDDAHKTHAACFFEASRSRSERIKIGLILFPQVAYQLCDQMLEVYGVDVKFSTEEDAVVPLVVSEKLATSSSLSDRYHTKSSKLGWLRSITTYPENSGLLIVSQRPFHSFSFLQRVFFQTVFVKEIRVAILHQLFARSFSTPAQLEDLFLLPKSVLLSNVSQQSGRDLEINPLRTIKGFADIRDLEKETPDVFQASPLALVNMHTDHNPSHWEELFQLLHRTNRHTTSAAFRRHANMEGSFVELAAGGGPVNPRPNSASTEKGWVQKTAVAVTTQPQSQLPHRSDIPSVSPRLLAVVENWEALPVHLRKDLLCLHDESESRSHFDIPSVASFQKCAQSTILRFACHPCRELLETSLLADETTRFKLAMAGAGFDAQVLADVESRIPTIWQLLSSLVLFHSLLAFRGNLLAKIAGNTLASSPPGGKYGFDPFVTAVDQLFHTVLQVKSSSGISKDTIFERLQQQLMLSVYTRKAIGQCEVVFLQFLYRECFNLMDHGRDGDTSRGSNSSSSTSSGATLDESSSKLQNPMVRRQNSTVRSLTRRTSSSFTVGGKLMGTTSPSATSRSRAAGTSSPSVLSFLNFPLEDLHVKTSNVDQWLELWWNYTDVLEERHDSQLCKLFSGSEHSGDDAINNSLDGGGGGSEDGIIGMPSATPPWMELFGWERHQFQGDDLAASVNLMEAFDAIQAMLQSAIPPQADSPPERSSIGDTEHHNLLQFTQNAAWTAYNRQVTQIQAYLRKLLREIEVQQRQLSAAAHTSTTSALPMDQCNVGIGSSSNQFPAAAGSLLHIDNESVRDQILALLRNEIPIEVWSILDSESDGGCCYAMVPQWSFDNLLTHYHHWCHFLVSKKSLTRRRREPHWFWTPALSPAMSMAHAIESAKTRYCEAHALHDDAYTVTFALQLYTAAEAEKKRNGGDADEHDAEKDRDGDQHEFPEGTFAVFDGLGVFGALWNQDLGYLEPLDGRDQDQQHPQQQPRSPAWQRVLLLCTLEEQHHPAPQCDNGTDHLDAAATRGAKMPSQQLPMLKALRRKRQMAARYCPLLCSGNAGSGNGALLLYEVELPVAPSLQPFVTPYLTFAIPTTSPTQHTQRPQPVCREHAYYGIQ